MKRRILTIPLFLLLGAVVNVIVAWVIALTVEPWPGRRAEWEAGGRLLTTQSFQPAAGEREAECWDSRLSSRPGVAMILVERQSTNRDGVELIGEYPPSFVPRWCPLVEPTPECTSGALEHEYRGTDARGWPMLTLWSEHRWEFTDQYFDGPHRTDVRVFMGIETGLPRWRRVNFVAPRTLPLHPIWRGFVVNTAFYAVLLWLVWTAPFAACRLRRNRRIRRGRCIRCGYDLRGQSDGDLRHSQPRARGESEIRCPECGWRREEGER